MHSIIDVSSVIYGGHNSYDRRIRGFPVGGLRKLFGIINAGLSHSDFILCFDGASIIKKELLPTYKAGRVPDYSVMAQIELAKYLLTQCDMDFYLDDKYEADDLIYSVCNELLFVDRDDSILIYTDDRDIACCVTDQISIQNVTSNGICLDKGSYSKRVVSGRVIPYNSILLWKIFHGDASDNYRSLRIPGLTFESVANNVLGQIEPLIGDNGFTQLAFSDYDVFSVIADDYKENFSEADVSKLKEQARIVFPYKLKLSTGTFDDYVRDYNSGTPIYSIIRKYLKVFGSGNFNRSKFDFYCTLLGLNRTKLNRSVDEDSADAQEFFDLLSLRARELSSGELAVRYSRTKRNANSNKQTLSNMEIPL